MLHSVPGIEVKKMVSLVLVRGLGNRIITTDEYVVLTVYIDGLIDNDTLKAVCFFMEVHLVDDLKANLLIGNNVLIL